MDSNLLLYKELYLPILVHSFFDLTEKSFFTINRFTNNHTNIMLPLFLGQEIEINNVLRAMVGLTLFNAAFCAEYVRGGLQIIPRGQYEASHALGLNSTIMTAFIILPQALRAIIPALVGMFIGILKDTSLVMIVGLFYLFGMDKKVIQNPAFIGTHKEVYMFVAFVFFVSCYILSHISLRIEKALGVGKR